MTGPEHYLAAEQLIDDAPGAFEIALAQAHATLALAAATAVATTTDNARAYDVEAWERVCSVRRPCTRCGGPNRVTVGMVCQACGRDYGAEARDD